jgi:rubrerythrin
MCNELKEKIQHIADTKYKGAYRFFKEKNLKQLIGESGFQHMKSVTSNELHSPICLMVHCYMNDIHEYPTCVCGNKQKFNTTKREFSKYCSNKCRFNNFSDILEVRKQSNLLKYGNTNVLASDFGKAKIKHTLMEKYGVDNYTKTQEYKEWATGKKRSTEAVDKVRLKHLEKYYNKLTEKFSNVKPLFELSEYQGVAGYKKYDWECLECGNIFTDSISFESPPTCKKCKPIGTKHELLIRNQLDKWGIDYSYNWRKLPSGKELDIYIPSKKLGIEVCGLFWHSTSRGCEKYYHLDKLNECNSINTELITIFDDEIYQKSDIVIRRLKSKLGLVKRKIYARKCEVVDITAEQSTKFLNKYHIQGPVGSTIRYGLVYRNRLIAIMLFNKGRYVTGNSEKEGVYELTRYCTVANFSIVGGAGKLFKHFIKNVNPEMIYSYSDKRWNTGKMYKDLGMIKVSDTAPNYYYTKDCMSRLHRSLFQKHKLKDMKSYDESLTEEDIMKLEKYHRIYDCGSSKYEWSKCQNPHLQTNK